uniref:Uncharacterized protein n=1 Tax=Oryza sativa subsp. japonica TaxID=39947 RepID=Q5VPS8_ORYSJ|nr:hypothetical protein [Oryza sativa Japonica Group]
MPPHPLPLHCRRLLSLTPLPSPFRHRLSRGSNNENDDDAPLCSGGDTSQLPYGGDRELRTRYRPSSILALHLRHLPLFVRATLRIGGRKQGREAEEKRRWGGTTASIAKASRSRPPASRA